MLPEQKPTSTPGRRRHRRRIPRGIYCSGIPAKDDNNVVTAEDIRLRWKSADSLFGHQRRLSARARLRFTRSPPQFHPERGRVRRSLAVRQSPQRKDVAAHCSNYSRNGDCYPPEPSRATTPHRREHSDVARSFKRQIALARMRGTAAEAVRGAKLVHAVCERQVC